MSDRKIIELERIPEPDWDDPKARATFLDAKRHELRIIEQVCELNATISAARELNPNLANCDDLDADKPKIIWVDPKPTAEEAAS